MPDRIERSIELSLRSAVLFPTVVTLVSTAMLRDIHQEISAMARAMDAATDHTDPRSSDWALAYQIPAHGVALSAVPDWETSTVTFTVEHPTPTFCHQRVEQP